MENNEKYDVADDSSSFSCLPDEIVLQILSKLVDFKTLCLCKLVSKRFGRILHQVDTISFTSFTDPLASLADPPTEKLIPTDIFAGSYWSAIKCLANFGRVKSLRIQVPSSFDNNHLLFKWMVKFGISVDSFVFLSPNSVFPNKELYVNANGQEEEEDMELYLKKFDIACECLKDVAIKFKLLMQPIISLPLLQDVSITDPGQKVRVSLNGEKVAEMRNLSEAGELKKHAKDLPCRISDCYVPLLKLPASGYVMKGVTLILFGSNDLLDDDIDSFMKINLNDFEDKEEVAYSEAVIEIVKKHRSRIERLM